MVYAPGHFQQTAQQSRTRWRFRSRRERVVVWLMGVMTVALVALAVYSLTNHQRTTGHGCVDFSYSTMIGGAEVYQCGTQARRLCATPSQKKAIDEDYLHQLFAACRKAGLRTGDS